MAVKEESKHQHLSKNVYKQNWNLRKIRNIQVLEKLCQHQHRPQTYPNIPKQLEPQGWERYEDPGPCTSRDRVVTIPNLPMVAPAIGLNQLCIGIVQLLSSQWRKNASLQFVEIVPAKKKTRVMTMICRIPPQFLVEMCKTRIFEGVWNDGSASGNHVTLVSGLRSLALVTCHASGAADTFHEWKTCFRTSSDCTCGRKI